MLRLLKTHFGEDRRLDKISKADARAFKTALTAGDLANVDGRKRKQKERALSRTTVEKHMRHAKAFFEFAARDDNDIIEYNAFASIRGRPSPARQWRPVTLEEFWKLYRAAEGGWKLLLALCRLAALRRSDALALRWVDVDFEEGVLRFTAVKTGREQRVPICKELAGILRSARRDSLRIDGAVVPQRRPRDRKPKTGERRDLVYVGNIGRDFRRLCERAGVAFYADPCHTLRKSCINDWARRHPANAVQAWAGHGSIATTIKYYSRVGREDELRAQGPLHAEGLHTEGASG